jgi:Tol biopolymer transport system component
MKRRLLFLLLILVGPTLLMYRVFNSADYHLFIKPDVGGHGHGYIYYDDGVWTRRVFIGDENELEVYYADLSPDGSTIVFTRNAFLYFYDLKSNKLTSFNIELNQPFVNTPTQWSPDGRRIGFSCSHVFQEPPEICVWDVTNTELSTLNDLRAYGKYDYLAFGSWSADAKALAFIIAYSESEPQSGRQLILKLDTDTGRVTQVLDSKQTKMNIGPGIALSPDGKTILFGANSPLEISENAYVSSLYQINADGSGLRRLVHFDAWSLYQPVWSPDGNSFYVNASNFYLSIPLKYDLSGKLVGMLPFKIGRTMLSWRSPPSGK